MANKTASEVYEKWKNNLSGSIQYVKDGVNRVTESPMAKAAANEEKWFQNLSRARSQGRFKRGLLGTSLEEWKAKTAEVGADRIPAGAAAAAEKSTKFYEKLLPFEARLQADVKKMPSTTIQDSIARATKWITGMAEFDKTK